MQLCHQLCIVLLAHVKRTSFVLSSTIFNVFFSHTFDGHLVSMRVLA